MFSSYVRNNSTRAVFSYKLRYIVGFWLVEMAISTNQKPTIYRNLYENTGPDAYVFATNFNSQLNVSGYIHVVLVWLKGRILQSDIYDPLISGGDDIPQISVNMNNINCLSRTINLQQYSPKCWNTSFC